MSRATKNLSSLIFCAGLAATAGFAVLSDEGFNSTTPYTAFPTDSALLTLKPRRGLTAKDHQAARNAWQYFEQNYRPETGLVDAVAGFPSGTLWDQGSYLLALVAAHRLNLITEESFGTRAQSLLKSIKSIELFEAKLPNKVYNTQTLAMVDYQNQPVPGGIGWSALDVARLLSAFRMLEVHHPEYGADLRAILARWDLAAMAREGRLYGAHVTEAGTEFLQEGRIGYEQYGARAAALWGLDVLDAVSAKPIVQWRQVAGVLLPTDRRSPEQFTAITPTLSEPFFLQALELGLSSEGHLMASKVYLAQENRFRDDGIPTMVSESHIDQPPHFLYMSIFSNGEDWAVVDEHGGMHPDLRSISLKATFAWDAIFETEYTQMIRQQLADLAHPAGWASGKYEIDLRPNEIYTANTNAVVLQALYYKQFGPMLTSITR